MHPSIHRLNAELRELSARGLNTPVPLEPLISDGIRLWVDEQGTDYSIELRTSAAAVLAISVVARKPGQWLTINFDLGEQGIAEHTMIGFAVRTYAARTTTARAAIRIHQSKGFRDHFFEDYVVAHGKPSTHCDVLWLDSTPALRTEGVRKEFVFFFDPEGFSVDLTTLRFFSA